MSILLIICAVVVAAAVVYFSFFKEKRLCRRLPLLVYGGAMCAYLLLVNQLVDMLNSMYVLGDVYTTEFVVAITAAAMIPFIAMIVAGSLNAERHYGKISNVILVIIPLVLLSFTVNCVVSNSDYSFLLVFIPPHLLLSLVCSVCAFENYSRISGLVKTLIVEIICAIACICGAVMLLISGYGLSLVTFILFLIVLILATTGIVCLVLERKSGTAK